MATMGMAKIMIGNSVSTSKNDPMRFMAESSPGTWGGTRPAEDRRAGGPLPRFVPMDGGEVGPGCRKGFRNPVAGSAGRIG
jgi:hypothetical protein